MVKKEDFEPVSIFPDKEIRMHKEIVPPRIKTALAPKTHAFLTPRRQID